MRSNLQNDTDLKIHNKIILQFFKDCKDKKLLSNTIKPQQNNTICTRWDISKLTDQAIEKIRKHRIDLKNNEKTQFLSDKEHDALQFSRCVSFLRDTTEDLKISLQLIIDPLQVKSCTELGKYLNEIYNKLGYNDDKKSKMNRAFQKDLRNALSHNNYSYKCDKNHVKSITWQDHNQKHTWNQVELSKSISKIICINGLIGKIINGKF